MDETAPGWLKRSTIFPGKQYFLLMEVGQYTWATGELVSSAEESVNELEKELASRKELILFFVPLAKFDPSGIYPVAMNMPCLYYSGEGSIGWSYLPKEIAFINFEEECRNACDTFRSYLLRLLSYALAHGMDVALVKGKEADFGRSILHPLPHSELHADVGEYDD